MPESDLVGALQRAATALTAAAKALDTNVGSTKISVKVKPVTVNRRELERAMERALRHAFEVEVGRQTHGQCIVNDDFHINLNFTDSGVRLNGLPVTWI